MPASSQPGARQTPDLLTIYVATCQIAPFDHAADAIPSFRSVKFPARVAATAKIEAIQKFLISQWMIAKSPYLELPAGEQFFTFKGRILRLDGTLDAYYLMDQDTVYLRFASLGKICDPCAMSTSELRVELLARSAYEPKLQPDDLMARLQDLLMRESRLQRLQQATRLEEVDRVQAITNELRASSLQQKRALVASPSGWPRPASLATAWPLPPSPNRTVFLSIAALERRYQVIPRDVLEPALFVFDTDRKWVFDAHTSLQREHFDYHYMSFEPDFLEMLTLKEEAGMVFWFRPQKSYEKLSSFLTSFEDPVTRKPYEPLLLKEAKWLTLCGDNGWEGKVRRDGRRRDTTRTPKFTRSVVRVVSNLRSASFEYVAVQELLYQSNQTLLFAPI